MQSRREILKQSLVLPFAKHSPNWRTRTEPSECDIISDATCLSIESLSGFRSLYARSSSNIIVAGVQGIAPALASAIWERVNYGSWLVWDHAPHFTSAADRRRQAELLNELFGIRLGEAISASHSELYVRYLWHVPQLVRTFLAYTPVLCSPNEAVATYGNVPVAVRRRVGRGGVVFLGSMLGPQLKAGDREAHQLASRLLLTA